MRWAVTTLVAMAVLLGAACSGDDSSSTTTTTTTAPEPVEVSDEQYGAVLDQFAAQVAAAGTDLCQLMAATAFSSRFAPSNPEQVQASVDEIARLFRALAGAEGVPEGDAEVLRSAAEDLQERAEAAGYSVEFISGVEAQEILGGEDATRVLGALTSRSVEECPTAAAPTTAPSGLPPLEDVAPAG